MNSDFTHYLLQLTKAGNCHVLEVIQELWSGYGQIVRVQLNGSQPNTLIIKEIALEKAKNHPRGWNTDLSHQRKVKSYQVETHWYKEWSALCNQNCRIPTFLGYYETDSKQYLVLEDLDTHFPKRRAELNVQEAKVCLEWLAHFHARFMGNKPGGLWPVGTYWHLATRPDEWAKMQNQELKAKAHLIDQKLNQAQFQTIVHGDAKVANFCFSEEGDKVAAVDFQYVGGGCGMKDVAYFLGSCLSSSACQQFEDELLSYYFAQLKGTIEGSNFDVSFTELENEWRSLYPFAIADFTRFLLGWMPTHQKVNDYHLKITKDVLKLLY